jgi:hypothetical protein
MGIDDLPYEGDGPEPSEWPTYTRAPRDSVFAIGVVSINYAQLEFALTAMFSTTLNIPISLASIIIPKIGNDVRTKLMIQTLPERPWPDRLKDQASHFITGFSICAENRNLLVHSNMFSGSPDAIVLFKSARDGRTIQCNPTLAELRKVADDMHTYFNYGLWLSNHINQNSGGCWDPTGAPFSLPDKPESPTPLEYTSSPFQVRPFGP